MAKVMAVSHAYVEPYTRVGLIKDAAAGFDFAVAVPKSAAAAFHEGYETLKTEFPGAKAIDSVFNFHHSVRMYLSGLEGMMRKFQPDILFIDNEPWSTTAAQAVHAARRACPKAKLVVYTSENLERGYGFPFGLFEKYVLGSVPYALTVSEKDGKEVLLKKGYRGKIEYCPLSVDTDRFLRKGPSALRDRLLNGARGVFLAGYIGRCVREKGIGLAFKALKNTGNRVHLAVIGNGPLENELRCLARELGVAEQVHFTGNVFYAQLPEYINCLDALVLPSLTTPNWKEQFGRVLVESMACEVPVVGSSSGEIPAVIGDAGLVFRENDAEDLAAKLSVLTGSDGKRLEFGAAGRKRVLEKFSRKSVDAWTAAFYKRILDEGTV